MNRIELSDLEPNKQIIIQSIKKVLSSKSEIKFAYLYGSFITPEWTPKSDIDIGIVVSSEFLHDKWLDISITNLLNAELHNQYIFDVRILNERSPKFVYEAIFNTLRLISCNETEQIEYETRIILEWYDMRPLYEEYAKWQKQAF